MTPGRQRSQTRRRARQAGREAAFERQDERALAINSRMWAHGMVVRAVRALVANRTTRSAALWVTGLIALCSLLWTLGRALA